MFASKWEEDYDAAIRIDLRLPAPAHTSHPPFPPFARPAISKHAQKLALLPHSV